MFNLGTSYCLWFPVYLLRDNDTERLTDPLCLLSSYIVLLAQASLQSMLLIIIITSMLAIYIVLNSVIHYSYHQIQRYKVVNNIWFLLKLSLIYSYIYTFLTNFEFWFYIFLWLDLPLGCILVSFVKKTFF